jgi:hypothetical protein
MYQSILVSGARGFLTDRGNLDRIEPLGKLMSVATITSGPTSRARPGVQHHRSGKYYRPGLPNGGRWGMIHRPPTSGLGHAIRGPHIHLT